MFKLFKVNNMKFRIRGESDPTNEGKGHKHDLYYHFIFQRKNYIHKILASKYYWDKYWKTIFFKFQNLFPKGERETMLFISLDLIDLKHQKNPFWLDMKVQTKILEFCSLPSFNRISGNIEKYSCWCPEYRALDGIINV